MRANGSDFITGSDNCPNGTCNAANSCKTSAKDADVINFGEGNNFKINSARPFQVYAQFMTNPDRTYLNLTNIKVTLTQDLSKVEMLQDCGQDYFDTFAALMRKGGSLGAVITNSDAGTDARGNNEFDKDCVAACPGIAKMTVSDFTWWETDSYMAPTPTQ